MQMNTNGKTPPQGNVGPPLAKTGLIGGAIIFGFAWLFYDVDVGGTVSAWLVSCALVAAMAASVSLALCSLCSSVHQVQLLSSFGVLLLSAIGGSMVPRFLMPEWLQRISWFTPNAWAIEAFQNALRPGQLMYTMAIPATTQVKSLLTANSSLWYIVISSEACRFPSRS